MALIEDRGLADKAASARRTFGYQTNRGHAFVVPIAEKGLRPRVISDELPARLLKCDPIFGTIKFPPSEERAECAG